MPGCGKRPSSLLMPADESERMPCLSPAQPPPWLPRLPHEIFIGHIPQKHAFIAFKMMIEALSAYDDDDYACLWPPWRQGLMLIDCHFYKSCEEADDGRFQEDGIRAE